MANMRQVCDFNIRSSRPSLQAGMRITRLFAFWLALTSSPWIAYADEDASAITSTAIPSARLEAGSTASSSHPVQSSTEQPTEIHATRIDGFMNGWVNAVGNAEARKPNLMIQADEIRYLVPDERCIAQGNVVIKRGTEVITGPQAEYNLKDHSGLMESPQLTMPKGPDRARPSRASAALGVFLDELHSHLNQVHYSTCSADQEDWYLTSNEMDLNSATQIGDASSASIVFKGVPLVYSPFITFPMNDHRKSGFLAPDFGASNNGFETTIPYYFNIAPNMDDTLIPRYMSNRGLMLANEFRYLEPNFSGKFVAEHLDHDRLTGTNRHFASLQQVTNLGNGFGLTINAQEASDNDYFRDLGSTAIPNVNAAANPYLPRDFLLTKQWDLWSLNLHTLSFQTLNDPKAPIGDQYRMRPQFVANYSRDLMGMDFDFNNEYTDFRHPTSQNGQRYVSVPSLRLPVNLGWGFVAPKVSLHYTNYNLEPLGTTAGSNLSRTLPISSIDSGLFFDRDLIWDDKAMTQTLEPRLFYVYIPFKDQTKLPLFNTGVSDFSYSQLFSENQFSGPDRVSEANQITAAIQSRLVNSSTGEELIRGVLGQRYHFEAQQTSISGAQVNRTSNTSDILAGVSGRINSRTTSSFSWDYNPTLQRTEKLGVDWRYIPEPGQAVNLGYRINRDTPGQADIRQIDISAELPIGGGWSGVGRFNYDTAQSTIVESLFGAEYTSGCWAFRVVTDRVTVSSTQVNSVLYMQLELTGMVRLGKNPLEALKSNIPGYRKTNEFN